MLILTNSIQILPNQNESSNLGICFSKTNPQFKSLGSGIANLDLRVRQPGLIRIRDLQILIFKDWFGALVLRICEDLLDLWKQVESFENWLDLWSWYKPNPLKSGFVTDDKNRIFLSLDLWPSNQYKSMDSWNESMFLQISYTIPASLLIQLYYYL